MKLARIAFVPVLVVVAGELLAVAPSNAVTTTPRGDVVSASLRFATPAEFGLGSGYRITQVLGVRGGPSHPPKSCRIATRCSLNGWEYARRGGSASYVVSAGRGSAKLIEQTAQTLLATYKDIGKASGSRPKIAKKRSGRTMTYSVELTVKGQNLHVLAGFSVYDHTRLGLVTWNAVGSRWAKYHRKITLGKITGYANKMANPASGKVGLLPDLSGATSKLQTSRLSS